MTLYFVFHFVRCKKIPIPMMFTALIKKMYPAAGIVNNQLYPKPSEYYK